MGMKTILFVSCRADRNVLDVGWRVGGLSPTWDADVGRDAAMGRRGGTPSLDSVVGLRRLTPSWDSVA